MEFTPGSLLVLASPPTRQEDQTQSNTKFSAEHERNRISEHTLSYRREAHHGLARHQHCPSPRSPHWVNRPGSDPAMQPVK
jgi:hypothetical protein